MYGLPADFDSSVFVGRELLEVCFTANTIHFVFDQDISVTLESSFILQQNLENHGVKQSVPVSSSDLMCLVGKQIRSVHADANGTLTLQFEEGVELTYLDDSKQYESYRIRIADREIIV